MEDAAQGAAVVVLGVVAVVAVVANVQVDVATHAVIIVQRPVKMVVVRHAMVHV